jgi:hypothetical protein
MLCNGVNAAAISWMIRKLNAFKLLSNRLLDKVMCASVSGKQIGHLALRGLTCHTLNAFLIYFIGIR